MPAKPPQSSLKSMKEKSETNRAYGRSRRRLRARTRRNPGEHARCSAPLRVEDRAGSSGRPGDAAARGEFKQRRCVPLLTLHEFASEIVLGSELIVAAAAKPKVCHGRWAASCVSDLVVELETSGFAAAHAAVVDVSATPFVTLSHCATHGTGYMPAAPAREIGAVTGASVLGRRLGSVIALER